jgi:polar amino acid transport system substrate-binding protein
VAVTTTITGFLPTTSGTSPACRVARLWHDVGLSLSRAAGGRDRMVRTGGLVFALVAALAGGCAATPGGSPAASADLTAPRPLGVQDPAPPASAPSDGGTAGCDRRASLRPRGAPPPPGRMPAGSTMARIVRDGRLIVGIDQDAYLFSFRDQVSGELVGFEIDIARRIASALFGKPDAVQFRAITTADRIPVLQRGEVDMVIRTMTMNCERWRQVAFSTEYLSSGQRLLVREGSGIKGLADLGGRKVCASNGSSSIPNLQRAQSRPVAVSAPLLVDCLVLLQQHQVDAISSIDTLLATLAVQDPNTRIVGDRITDDPAGIAMPRGADDLVRFVNAVLDGMRRDGSWAASYTHWFGTTAPSPPPPRYRD